MLIVLAGTALAGCTNTTPGQVVSSDQPSSPAAPPHTSVAIPPRPQEIKLDGRDPCKLLTKAQVDQIKVNHQRNVTLTTDPFKGSPVCSMDGGDGQVFWHYEIVLVTSEGIGPWLSGKRNVDAKLVDVGGYAAAEYKVLGTTTFDCSTTVDVADGQQMEVEFRPITRNAFTQDQMCQKSEQAAGFALQTLQTMK